MIIDFVELCLIKRFCRQFEALQQFALYVGRVLGFREKKNHKKLQGESITRKETNKKNQQTAEENPIMLQLSS